MDSVKLAVSALHSHACSADQRQQATRWLESFQNTLSAWSVSMQLLAASDGDISPEPLKFFAAQTLKHKVIASRSHAV